MRFIIFWMFFMVVGEALLAQDDWVFTMKSDTIYGKIGFINKDAYTMDQVSIKEGKTKHIFETVEVKRVRKKGKDHVPLKVNGKYQFGQVISEGYLSWYKYINPESNAVDDFSATVLIKQDGSSVQLTNIGFMKSLSRFLIDCYPLNNEIKSKAYKPRDLGKIIEFYNDWIDERSDTGSVKSTIVESENAKIISDILRQVKQDEVLSKNEEFIEMLTDVQTKLNNGKEIPSYLKGAVLEILNDNQAMTEKFNSLFD